MIEKMFEETLNVNVVFNSSKSLKRTLRLLTKGSVSFRFLVKNLLCQLKDYRFFWNPKKINTVKDLVAHLNRTSSQILVMYRTGIIIPKFVLDHYQVINVHVTRLPKYAGLGSVLAALDAKDLNQCATAHRASLEIDSGEIIFQIPYELDLNLSYCSNESKAYSTGIQVITRIVESFKNLT